MNSTRKNIEEIKVKLKEYQLFKEQLGRDIFLQNHYCWDDLDSPIPSEDIELFESATGISFPGGIRMFLSEIGSGGGQGEHGGIGPDYGIVSVKLRGDTCTIAGVSNSHMDMVEIMSAPFPFTEEYNLPDTEALVVAWEKWSVGYNKTSPYFTISSEGVVEYSKYKQEDMEAYYLKNGPGGKEEYYDRMPFAGIMPICAIGCGLSYFVVITGQSAGEVWIDARDNWGGYEPVVNEYGEHMDFTQWYLEWLSNALKELSKMLKGNE